MIKEQGGRTKGQRRDKMDLKKKKNIFVPQTEKERKVKQYIANLH